jgi:hypothetical protein
MDVSPRPVATGSPAGPAEDAPAPRPAADGAPATASAPADSLGGAGAAVRSAPVDERAPVAGDAGDGDPGRSPVQADAAAPGAGPGTGRRRFEPGAVTVGELLVFAAATVVGVVALVSLAAAHAGHHSLATVGAGSALLLAALGALAWFGRGRPRVVADVPGLLLLAGFGILALVMFVPGFHYVAGDKDPGGYVMHAYAIARTGSYQIHDPLMTTPGLPVQLTGPGARFPGIWVHDAAAGVIVPQFYHLWPALMATAYDLHGYGGLANTGPLLGVLAVLLAVALARRLGGWVAGAGVGLLLTTNMMQVWQAKYPTAEILAQALYLGALLGIVLAVQTRWRWPALVAGILVGVGYLDRADALLLVLAAVGGLACLWVLRRFDARAGWFAAGLAAVTPYGMWQAYGPAGLYSRMTGIPSLAEVLAAIAVCAVGAVALRPVLAPVTRWLDARWADRGLQRRAGWVFLAGACLLFVLALLRPLFETDTTPYQGRIIQTYDERNLYRLSWFFTWPGLLLMMLGVAVILLRRWSALSWLVLALTGGLLVLYCWHARNSPYFMWVGRRFVPTVVPGMLLLSGLALAWLWSVRPAGLRLAGRRLPALRLAGPAVAVGLAGFITVIQLQQSLPLRSHDEWGGSDGVVRAVAELSGNQQGVYLWQRAAYCCAAPQLLFASPLWLVEDEQSMLLPGSEAAVPAFVQAYVRHFPDRPVFLVYDRAGRPPPLPGLAVTPVARFTGGLPHWLESSLTRPAVAQQIPYDFTVFRVQQGAAG